MKVSDHIKLSAMLGLLMYWAGNSMAGAMSCFIAGIAVDGDHIFDYLVNYKIPLRRFFDGKFLSRLIIGSPDIIGRELRAFRRDWRKPLKSTLLLHSLEFIFLILTITGIDYYEILTPVLVGLIGHYMADYMTWGRTIFSFSFIYRAARSFNLDEEYFFRQKLIKAGINTENCFSCGVKGRTELHWEGTGLGYKTAPLDEFEVLCPECHDSKHERR